MRRRRGGIHGTLVFVAGTLAATCSGGADSKQCVSAGDAEVCAEPDGGGLVYTASGLKPGTDVTFVVPVIGSNEVAVSPSGGFDTRVGLLSASGSFSGTVDVTATAADGTPLSGILTFG